MCVRMCARAGRMLVFLGLCVLSDRVLASVVPVRHDRRRELKAVGAERPSHIPMWCVCVCERACVWVCVCRE